MKKTLILYFILWLGFTHQILACDHLSSSSERVVYIGDSHTVGDFGDRLSENLTKKNQLNEVQINRFGVVGAAANHWSKKDISSLQKLKNGYYCDGEGKKKGIIPNNYPTASQLFLMKPIRVIIALGTNDINLGCKIKDKNVQMAATKELLSQIRQGSKCYWVGPTEQLNDGPIAKNCGQAAIKLYVDNLQETVKSRCDFIDSRKITQYGKSILPNRTDKLHYEGALAKHWADSVAQFIDLSPVSKNQNQNQKVSPHKISN